MDRDTAVRLLIAAGVLMLLSGCIFAFTRQWVYTALVWVGKIKCKSTTSTTINLYKKLH